MRDIWIFQMAEPIGHDQEAGILEKIRAFLQNWKSHGAPVPGSAEILHNQFVVVKAQPGSTSGCSIDDMTHNVTSAIEAQGCTIVPSNFVFYRNGNGPIEKVDFRQIKEAIANGNLRPETTIFTISMMSESEFGNFELPMRDSWAARFLPKTV